MPDREKAINGLKHCKIGYCVGCPYDQIREESLHGKHDKWELVCNEQLTEDILSLLMVEELSKEQEAVAPVLSQTSDGIYASCGKCKTNLWKIMGLTITISPDDMPKFCPKCGQAVKWNEID